TGVAFLGPHMAAVQGHQPLAGVEAEPEKEGNMGGGGVLGGAVEQLGAGVRVPDAGAAWQLIARARVAGHGGAYKEIPAAPVRASTGLGRLSRPLGAMAPGLVTINASM